LAVTGDKRSAAAPELPTVAETGLPGYEVSVWYGVLAPAGTPSAVINRLHTEIVKIMKLPDITTRWATLGAEPLSNTPEQFAAFLRSDLVKWTKVVRDSGAKVD
jgi:tripartite-type tricarboxylate transporter receptor subunit TctC